MESRNKLSISTFIAIVGIIITIVGIALNESKVRHFVGIDKKSTDEQIITPLKENVNIDSSLLTKISEQPSIQTNFTSINNTTENNKISHSTLQKEQIAKNNIYINNLKGLINKSMSQNILVYVAINDKS